MARSWIIRVTTIFFRTYNTLRILRLGKYFANFNEFYNGYERTEQLCLLPAGLPALIPQRPKN